LRDVPDCRATVHATVGLALLLCRSYSASSRFRSFRAYIVSA
jgi:hypothetical protein